MDMALFLFCWNLICHFWKWKPFYILGSFRLQATETLTKRVLNNKQWVILHNKYRGISGIILAMQWCQGLVSFQFSTLSTSMLHLENFPYIITKAKGQVWYMNPPWLNLPWKSSLAFPLKAPFHVSYDPCHIRSTQAIRKGPRRSMMATIVSIHLLLQRSSLVVPKQLCNIGNKRSQLFWSRQ